MQRAPESHGAVGRGNLHSKSRVPEIVALLSSTERSRALPAATSTTMIERNVQSSLRSPETMSRTDGRRKESRAAGRVGPATRRTVFTPMASTPGFSARKTVLKFFGIDQSAVVCLAVILMGQRHLLMATPFPNPRHQ